MILSSVFSLSSLAVLWGPVLDETAIALVLAGLLCQLMQRRMPAGLGPSLFVAFVSVAAGLAAFRHRGPAAWNLFDTCHVTTTLAALWAVMGWLTGGSRRPDADARVPSNASVFFAWALVCGIATVVFVIKHFAELTWLRMLNPWAVSEAASLATFLGDLVALILCLLLWSATGPHPTRPTMFLFLAALTAWGTGLAVERRPQSEPGAVLPAWWDWVFQVFFALALVLVAAAVIQDSRFRRLQRRAWPDRLDDLVAPYGRWPFYSQLESIIATAVLLLGVYQFIQWEPRGPAHAAVSFVVSAAAATACAFMAYRRWSGNTASVGLALYTLAAVWASGCMAGLVTQDAADGAYALRMPRLFNAMLFALLVMVAWWRWLAEFWRQQLLDHTAWTTTGRMIPLNKRVAFILTALAMLIAFQMSLWPVAVADAAPDNTAGRVACGLAAIALFMLYSARFARRQGSSTNATLCVIFALAAATFVFVRLPPSAIRGWTIQYQAVVFSVLALPILTLAEALRASSWRCFSMPLWWLSLLILPAAALLNLVSPQALPAEWVKPMALAILGAVYAFAGSREHRRAFLVLGTVLLIAAVASLFQVYGTTPLAARGGGPASISAAG